MATSQWNAAAPLGEMDTRRAAELLAARIPAQLAVFAHLAFDFACFWHRDGRRLFSEIDAEFWGRCKHNPVSFLAQCPTDRLVRAAGDRELLARAEAVSRELQAHRAQPFVSAGRITATAPVAFLCAEFGVYESLPIYAGGLGVLAGDLLKEASDRRVPMVGVGLYYRQGYFHQRLDVSCWQHEYWIETPPQHVPIALVTDAWGIPVTIRVRLWGEDVTLQIWRAVIGRTSLYLLDADRPENSQVARWLTARLYDSSPEIRLGQYALLGIGGIRALRALGVEASVVHLNEGHAALAVFELAREEIEAGLAPDDALALARERIVFTTHTPVPAGNETYPAEALWSALGSLPDDLGLSYEEILRWGRLRPSEVREPLGLTVLALRTSRSVNGVSRVHGGVSRRMWGEVWPDRSEADVPIRHITNGVHIPTWMAAPMQDLLTRHLGDGWIERADDPDTWAGVDDISDEELWAVRNAMRRYTVDFARERMIASNLGVGRSLDSIERRTRPLSPDILTIGFARRAAGYKRLDLLAGHDDRRFAPMLSRSPAHQWLLGGKAHPRDDEAKGLIQQAVHRAMGGEDEMRQLGGRGGYLEDYDLGVATRLVAGCDLWVNLPRPPLEACGTSGMKAVLNGGLHLSVLDGWWAEAFDGSNGWAMPSELAGVGTELVRERLLELLEHEILPLFYDRDADGVPRGWLKMMKRSLRTNGPRYCTTRMLGDYIRDVYVKA